MFDNLKSELNEYKQRADKAEYYKKALEDERATRNQVNSQVLSVLRDVRDRYESKMKVYTGKQENGRENDNSKSKNNKSSKDQKAAESSKHVDESKDDGANGWGQSALDSNKSNNNNDNNNKKNKKDKQDSNSNNNKSNTNTNENSGKKNKNKGSGKKNDNKSDQQTTQDNKDDDWNTTTKDDNNGDNNNSVGWGTLGGNDGGWGTTSDNTNVNDGGGGWGSSAEGGGWGTTNNQNDNANNNDDNNETKDDDQNTASEWGNSKTVAATECGTFAGWPDDTSARKDDKISKESKDNCTDGIGTNKKDKQQQSKNSSPAKKNDDAITSTTKEKIDNLKDQITTFKLEKRVIEISHANLEKEVERLKNECLEYKKKLDASKIEKSELSFRIRGLTTDLYAANEDTQKLNQKIDELEAEKHSKNQTLNLGESKRKAMENKYKSYQQRIADLESELRLSNDEKDELSKKVEELTERNLRLEKDSRLLRNLNETLRQGCLMVEDQAKIFETRHDTVLMTKADMERELVAIKEEASRHITTISQLQKSNEQLSSAFMLSLEEHQKSQTELEKLRHDYSRRLENYKLENHRAHEANTQLRKLVDFLQKAKR